MHTSCVNPDVAKLLEISFPAELQTLVNMFVKETEKWQEKSTPFEF